MLRREAFEAIYLRRSQEMSLREKIAYCAAIIYRTHRYLSNHSHHISRRARHQAMALLSIAEYRLTQLINQ